MKKRDTLLCMIIQCCIINDISFLLVMQFSNFSENINSCISETQFQPFEMMTVAIMKRIFEGEGTTSLYLWLFSFHKNRDGFDKIKNKQNIYLFPFCFVLFSRIRMTSLCQTVSKTLHCKLLFIP